MRIPRRDKKNASLDDQRKMRLCTEERGGFSMPVMPIKYNVYIYTYILRRYVPTYIICI